jgi:lipoprotein-anchoring transpeptidase ErfK/SrfK
MKSVTKLLIGLAFTAATIAPAQAKEGAKAQPVSLEVAAAGLAPGKFVWADAESVEPVTVVVSIPMQQAFVYRGQSLVATSAVSTGKAGDDTPTGVFPILQKAVKHTSNIYNVAMPYMQRLTWDGIALHAGANPGFPASHGCVRLPAAFAKKLFEVTDVGTTVVVTDQMIVDTALDPELLRTDATRANEAQMAALAVE